MIIRVTDDICHVTDITSQRLSYTPDTTGGLGRAGLGRAWRLGVRHSDSALWRHSARQSEVRRRQF